MRKGRWVVVVTVVLQVTGLLAAGPATAKKPRPEPPPPELATVSLSFVEEDGLRCDGLQGTSCGLQGTLQMRVDASKNGVGAYFADGRDGSSLPDLELRGFSDYMSQGLHTGVKAVDPDHCPDEPEPYLAALVWLGFDRKGDLDGFIWHFDIVLSRTEGPKGCSVRVAERYNIRALTDRELADDEAPLSFDPTTGFVSGTFNLHRYDADAVEPHLELARTFMKFRVTIGG